MDNMEYMSRFGDKFFDVACVDPEYGKDAANMTMGKGKNKEWNKGKVWDVKPPETEYFKELFRVSRNQIIWGGNYFTDKLPVRSGWIFWDKERGKDVSFADGELAWTSFDMALKKAPIRYDGFIGSDGNKIHPTQKPKALYRWTFERYLKDGDKILDTNLGSQSSRIVAYQMGFDFFGCEIDPDYFNEGNARFEREVNGIYTTKQGVTITAHKLF